jgi:hypothetical protein
MLTPCPPLHNVKGAVVVGVVVWRGRQAWLSGVVVKRGRQAWLSGVVVRRGRDEMKLFSSIRPVIHFS